MRTQALMKFLSRVASRAGVGRHVYVVGGAVRNFVLGEPIKDIDVVIDTIACGKDSEWFAKEVARAIPVETNLTTNQYGVAILTIKEPWVLDGSDMFGEVIEIANARKESYGGAAGKGYKPHMVEPATIDEDLYRREFSFNTLLWRLEDLREGPQGAEILDLTGTGLRDLKAKTLRTPSPPDKTFADDPSRLLRAVKFTSRYGLAIDQETKNSIRKNAHTLKQAPYNAIGVLLTDAVLNNPKTVRKALLEMKDLGLLAEVVSMMQTQKPFAAMLNSWASRLPITQAFEMIDLGLPLDLKLGFLSLQQQKQLRQILANLPENRHVELVEALRQPGRVSNTLALIEMKGLKGKEIGELKTIARQVLLDFALQDPLVMDYDLTEAVSAAWDRRAVSAHGRFGK